jgi:hypothetical protein
VLCPSSEAEFCPRVAGPTILVGCWAVIYLMCVLGSFVFCFFAKVSGFPPVF